jgi:hypothetical protein
LQQLQGQPPGRPLDWPPEWHLDWPPEWHLDWPPEWHLDYRKDGSQQKDQT